MRAYGKYLRQIGFAFSQSLHRGDARRPPGARRRPRRPVPRPLRSRRAATAASGREAAAPRTQVVEALDAIPSLDDDRICRAFLTLIDATVRTNYYRDRPVDRLQVRPDEDPRAAAARGRSTRSGCAAPRVEGVHLRGGAHRPRRPALERPAGGLPHRGPRADEGADGEERRDRADRAPRAASSSSGRRPTPTRCAPRSSSATAPSSAGCSTSPTTSSTGPTASASSTRPTPCVHDGDDPYLVVAADKGTATFSDIANEISCEYGFWLGDAFASGGSAGYDHKAMGITARGAWESVRRHARVLGKDADRDPLTAVGIGDMSGDVFGNGMLRSRALQLVAAFDHRHVFIDPDPDPAAAFAERQRLFELPRSSWADYDPALHLAGRRRLPAHAEVDRAQPTARAPCSARRTGPLTPNRADLGRSCGRPSTCCGTAASAPTSRPRTETNADVGDRANDGVRVERRRAALPDRRRGRQPRAHPARAASSTRSTAGSSTPTPSTTRPASTAATTRSTSRSCSTASSTPAS